MNNNQFALRTMLIVLITYVIISPQLLAQKHSSAFRSELSGAYAPGLQVYNSNVLFRPGYTVDFSHNYKFNKYINLGLGGGYMQLDDEHFIPIYINILALKSKKQIDRYVRCNLGYARAYSHTVSRMDNYDLKGGLTFRFGIGRTYPISDKIALSTGFSYAYQNARLKHQLINGRSYNESLDYTFFQLSIGCVFNYCSNE